MYKEKNVCSSKTPHNFNKQNIILRKLLYFQSTCKRVVIILVKCIWWWCYIWGKMCWGGGPEFLGYSTSPLAMLPPYPTNDERFLSINVPLCHWFLKRYSLYRDDIFQDE